MVVGWRNIQGADGMEACMLPKLTHGASNDGRIRPFGRGEITSNQAQPAARWYWHGACNAIHKY
jgi:hypothetical protein